MTITLDQILALVGKLDDSSGEDTARERFRRYLKDNVKEAGAVRDYVQECLRTSGDQYSRALQDLVNHLGRFLGFDVTFGRYHGVRGELGYDGHWQSPGGSHLVVEVKTTEVYAVKTTTLLGYVDGLISEKRIPDWGSALGLYVVGRPDPNIKQLENAILAEKRTHQLRIVSVESLLSLAEMMNEYDVRHEDILDVLRPSGPTIDPLVDLMARLTAGTSPAAPPEEQAAPPEETPTSEDVAFWLAPVKSDKEATAEEVIETLVGKEKTYAFGGRTPGRKKIKPGDFICFYAAGVGVVAHAQVTSWPENKVHPKIRHPDDYPWVFTLGNTKLYLDGPVVLDASLRNRLEAFKERDPNKAWGWFVVATSRVSAHDFKILTRQDQ